MMMLNAEGAVNPLDALLGPIGFPQLMDIPPADDDDAMVELAIALSLQEHEGAGGAAGGAIQQLQQGLGNLQNLQNIADPTLHNLQAFAAAHASLVQAQAAAAAAAGHVNLVLYDPTSSVVVHIMLYVV